MRIETKTTFFRVSVIKQSLFTVGRTELLKRKYKRRNQGKINLKEFLQDTFKMRNMVHTLKDRNLKQHPTQANLR